nr:CZB domain-containing protein [Methylomarinum sp. Ch1-1]MDP4519444.1 CZB domain-containing protein [Methylomarinum sp. Ch1-1]
MPAEEFPHWASNYHNVSSWQHTAQFHWSRQDFPLFTAELIYRRWINDLSASINAGTKLIPPPELDSKRCRFGLWYYNEGSARYGNLPTFKALEPIHEKIHRHAAYLVALEKSGRPNLVKEELKRLNAMHLDITKSLSKLQMEFAEKADAHYKALERS